MALSTVIRSQLTRRHAPEDGNTTVATAALTSSVRALDAVGKGSQATKVIASAVPVIASATPQTQAQVHELVSRLGAVVRDAEVMKRLKPVVTKAAVAYAQGEADRAEMLKKVGEAQQKVAVLNSKTQHEMYVGHTAASAEIAFHQGAYSGQGFRV